MTRSSDTVEEDFSIWSTERRIKLTRQIAVLSCLICLFYLAFDFLNGAFAYLPYYFILLTGSLTSIILLRYNRVTLAKIILLLSGTLLLGILASWETAETGLFMYFLVVGVAAFTIFGTEEKISAIAIGLFSVVVFYIVYFTDLLSFEQIPLSQAYIQSSFFINFCVCLVALMTIMYHIMTLSVKYERKMVKAQKEMMRLTTDLRESKSRFELAIQGSSVGIWDWDVVNDKLFISPLMVELLNYPEEKYQNMTSEKINRVIHPEDQNKVKKTLEEHLKNKLSFILECRLRKGDDTYIWILLSGQAQWDENGRPLRMVGTIVDVDDLKMALQKMEEQNTLLEKANEELDRFVYSTSHDLKAPLSSILGLVGIAEKSKDIGEIHECLKMIEKGALTLNGFISEIIDYSRNTRLAVENEEVRLKELVDDIVEGLQFFDKSDQIKFEIDIPKDLVIFTDKGRIKIILNNLITNAIKYQDFESGKKPYVRVAAKEEYHRMIIRVEDNGMGINRDFHNKIFDMFYRASEKSEGSGLGLYIAKEMSTKINAKLWLESEPGKGSAFHIKLPLS